MCCEDDISSSSSLKYQLQKQQQNTTTPYTEEYFKKTNHDSITTTATCLKTISSTKSIKKSVSFYPKVRVILIPTRLELQPIYRDLYYSSFELEMCKKDTFNELNSYRFSKACIDKREMLVKLGVFYDIDDDANNNNNNNKLIKETLVTAESDIGTDTDSECSSVSTCDHSILSIHTSTTNPASGSGTPSKSNNDNDDDDHNTIKVTVVESPPPDASYRYPVSLSSFDENECAMRIASIILYQPFTSFVSDF